MGQMLSRAMNNLSRAFGTREVRILILGLDAAGKTTVLYKLKLGEKVATIPTIGFNVETVQYKNVNFTMWDVGGQDKIRKLWHHYFRDTEGLIFVVDSSDRDRVDEARSTLHSLLQTPDMSNITLLVLANKSDLPQAMSVTELTQRLQLSSFRQKKWFVQSCCANSGEGLYEGLDWLASAMKTVKSPK